MQAPRLPVRQQAIRPIHPDIGPRHCRPRQDHQKSNPSVIPYTFATLLLENDVDIKYIQSLLGHSSIMTTQINLEKRKQILTEKHPRMSFSVTMQYAECRINEHYSNVKAKMAEMIFWK
jgi:hypothetical protein